MSRHTQTEEIEVEYAPGHVSRVQVSNGVVPRYVMCKLIQRPDGKWQPVPVDFSGTIRLTTDLPRKLGLDVTYYCLRRLVVAGFIKAYTLGSKMTLIDLESLNTHLQRTRTDLDNGFWTQERAALYREAHGPMKNGFAGE